jgi:hypothetical protein
MLVYEFEIIYKKQNHNVVEDSLSRKEKETKGSLCDISILQSNWVEEPRIEWKQYQELCNIIQQLQEDHDSLKNIIWNNFFLWYHDNLYLCKNSQLK